MTYISWSSDFALFSDSIIYNGIILCTLVQSGTVNGIVLFAGHCDLYFMVQ